MFFCAEKRVLKALWISPGHRAHQFVVNDYLCDGRHFFTCGHDLLCPEYSSPKRLFWSKSPVRDPITRLMKQSFCVWTRMKKCAESAEKLVSQILVLLLDCPGMLICQLGDRLGWRNHKKDHGPLQVFLQKRPWLFECHLFDTGRSWVRVCLIIPDKQRTLKSTGQIHIQKPPPGLEHMLGRFPAYAKI